MVLLGLVVAAGRARCIAAPTQLLVPEAGGACHTHVQPNGKLRLVFGSPALCERLLALIDEG